MESLPAPLDPTIPTIPPLLISRISPLTLYGTSVSEAALAHDDDEPTRVLNPHEVLEDEDPTFIGDVDVEELTLPSTKTLGARLEQRKAAPNDDLPERTTEMPSYRERLAARKRAQEAAAGTAPASEEPTMLTDSLHRRIGPPPGRSATRQPAEDDLARHVIREDELKRNLERAAPPGGASRTPPPPRQPLPAQPRPRRPSTSGGVDAPLPRPPTPANPPSPSRTGAEPQPPSPQPAAPPAPVSWEDGEDRADITGIIPNLNLDRRRTPAFVAEGKKVENPFAASVSGFYSLPDVSDDDIDTGLPRTVTLMALASTTIFATATVTSVCIREWWTPGEMIQWMSVVASAVAVAGGGALLWQEKRAFGLSTVLAAATPTMVSLAFALFVALLWTIPGFRAAAFTLLASEPDRIESVFTDDSVEVLTRACAELEGLGANPEWERVILAGATTRPEVAQVCLGHQDPAVAGQLAQSLADRWFKELTSEQNDDALRSCTVARTMSALPVPPEEIDARLLVCAMRHDDPEVQRCCAGSLAERIDDPAAWSTRLRSASEIIQDESTAIAIFSMAFHDVDLSEGQKALLDSAKFDGKESQRVALDAACSAALNGAWGVTRHFSPALEGRCAVDAGSLPRGREVWTNVCLDAERRLKNRTADPREILCNSTRTALVEKATLTASSFVAAAVRKESAEQLERGILTGIGIIESNKPQFRKPSSLPEEERRRRDSEGDFIVEPTMTEFGQPVQPAFRFRDFPP